MTPAEEYRRRAMAANLHPRDVANMFRRAQVLRDDDDDDDEYDSDMEGFIDNGQDGKFKLENLLTRMVALIFSQICFNL